jgi:hypothetical protein
MQKFRITTLNGSVLGHRPTRKKADELAAQQAIRLGETVLIKRWNAFDEVYEQVARVSLGGVSC